MTEFSYDKGALQRKRAIDDMRDFCLIGIKDGDWKDINELLKDEIYYYFNSKYARRGFKAYNNDPFSLLDDINERKLSAFELIRNYMPLVDADVSVTSGETQDSIKHLQGAIRLIRRRIDVSPALFILNYFCLLALKTDDENLKNEMDESFINGYRILKKLYKKMDDFYADMNTFKSLLNKNGKYIRNIAAEDDYQHLEELELNAELQGHLEWMDAFAENYMKE